MADVQQNLETWAGSYDWSSRGEEWSGSWGGSEAMWWGTLLPRIHAWVPTGTILEIAPGFGRWTAFLTGVCDRLIGVDLSQRCVDACRERFRGASHAEFHLNDGRSLAMVADESVDLVFSFDSLVHAEQDVIDNYLEQLALKLKPDGVGFIHHSNMGHFVRQAELAQRMPDGLRRRMVIRGWIVNTYAWRARSVTAESLKRHCDQVGLACMAQEKINWEFGTHLIDAISTFTRIGSRWERPNLVADNPGFMREAAAVARRAQLYSEPRRGDAAASSSSST
jgi:SAM-dependent methyltransferase